MNRIITKIIISIIIPILVFSGCSQEHESVDLGSNEEYVKFVGRVDGIIGSYDIDASESEIMKEFKEASAERQTEIAMELADDMAMANFLGLSGDEIMAISGTAVKAYPDPLLLNNFAVMVLEEEGAEESLYFLTLAVGQEPENPV